MKKAVNRTKKKKLKKIFKRLCISALVCAVCTICAYAMKDLPKTDKNPVPEKGNINVNTDTGSSHEYLTGPDGLYEASVTKIVDGDTLWCLYNGEELKVRFNLIDTPESVSPDQEKNNQYGVMASDYTKSLIRPGDTIYLQFDEEKTDMYGRTLAYIWLSDQVDVSDLDDIKQYMINYILIENGYAQVALYNNELYYDLFLEAEKEAAETQTGLWQYDEYRNMVAE